MRHRNVVWYKWSKKGNIFELDRLGVTSQYDIIEVTVLGHYLNYL